MQQMPDKTRETITKYLGDMHALENHGLQAIERQATQLKGEQHPEAVRAVNEFKTVLERHTNDLKRRLETLGESPTRPVKEAATVVAGVVAGLYNAVRTEEASKSIRDDYTFFSHVAVAYLMLHTTAKALGDDGTAQFAERGYRDAARMVMLIDDIMPGLVLQELRQDGAQVPDVGQDCKKMIHEAWTSQESSTRGGMSPAHAAPATSPRSTSGSGGASSGSAGSTQTRTPAASSSGATSSSGSSSSSSSGSIGSGSTGSGSSGSSSSSSRQRS
jgi:ferritin-like metal-binding protein YciE